MKTEAFIEWKANFPWYKRLWFWFKGPPKINMIITKKSQTYYSKNMDLGRWSKGLNLEGIKIQGSKTLKVEEE